MLFQIVLAKLMKARAAQEEQKKVFDIENKKLQLKNNEIKLKSDEEIKEVRLELEGKLEKMKEKMVSETESIYSFARKLHF